MEDIERVQIEALIGARQEATSESQQACLKIFARAHRVLDPRPDAERTQIIHGSDDDRMVKVKQKKIVYQSEVFDQELMLTNFHLNQMNKYVAVELPDERGYYSPTHPDYLFSITNEGVIKSPLGLIHPELAGAIVELFEEEPKVKSVRPA